MGRSPDLSFFGAVQGVLGLRRIQLLRYSMRNRPWKCQNFKNNEEQKPMFVTALGFWLKGSFRAFPRIVGWAVIFGALNLSAWAQQFEARRSVYVEAGGSVDNNESASTAVLGLSLPMQQRLWDGRISMAWNFYLGGWDGDAREGQRKYYAQIGVVPMFRYHFDDGSSPWFVEGGIGASYMHKTYQVGDKRFGSRWNFSNHLGVGRVFGAQQEQELGLYVKHVSNAGFKEPNPGETFLEVRYAHAF